MLRSCTLSRHHVTLCLGTCFATIHLATTQTLCGKYPGRVFSAHCLGTSFSPGQVFPASGIFPGDPEFVPGILWMTGRYMITCTVDCVHMFTVYCKMG